MEIATLVGCENWCLHTRVSTSAGMVHNTERAKIERDRIEAALKVVAHVRYDESLSVHAHARYNIEQTFAGILR